MPNHSKKRKGGPPEGQTPFVRSRRSSAKSSGKLDGKALLQALVIVAAVGWIFWPSLHGDWISDDHFYIPQNPLLSDPAGLWKIWFVPGTYFEYYPLEATIQWIQWQMWGADTLGYHLTNVVLHLVGAFLVWRLLSKFRLRLAWLGGLLFAIHPAQVESVAWISELKNTLSAPPFLLAMCAWIDWERHQRPRDYGLALGLFLVAMLCKISMALFPLVILLYAWWRRGRLGWGDLKACAPFLLISLALGLANIFVGSGYGQLYPETGGAVQLGGFFSRLACAGLVISVYFSHCVWPVGLLPHYTKWAVDPPSLPQFLPWLILGGTFYGCWKKRTTWGKHVVLGLGFFLINLAPFLGFNAISFMKFTWIMDHFLYLPLIGLIGLAVAGLDRIEERISISLHVYALGAIMVVMAFLAVESHNYAKLYLNEEALWTYALQRDPGDWLLWTDLGNALVQSGQDLEAKDKYEQALRLNPDYLDAHNDLGNVLFQTGQFSSAIEQYEQALRINPRYTEPRNNMGMALDQLGRHAEALKQYEQVVQINPQDVEARIILGDALMQAGRLPEAMDQYGQALRLKPDDAKAHNNLGIVLARLGRIPEAMEQFDQTLRINPHYPNARANLEKLQSLPQAVPAKQ